MTEQTLGDILDDAAKDQLYAQVHELVQGAVYSLLGDLIENGWIPQDD